MYLAKDFDEMAERIQSGLEKALVRVTMRTRNKVVEKSPVYKGFLTNNIHHKAPIVRGGGTIKTVSGEVFIAGSSILSGAVQEHGRRQGSRMPPHGPLRRWVQLKVDRGEFELDPRRSRRAALNQAAFLVRRKISQNPAKGIGFFKRTIPEAEMDLEREVNMLADEIVSEM